MPQCEWNNCKNGARYLVNWNVQGTAPGIPTYVCGWCIISLQARLLWNVTRFKGKLIEIGIREVDYQR